jgi:hypothetical protein
VALALIDAAVVSAAVLPFASVSAVGHPPCARPSSKHGFAQAVVVAAANPSVKSVGNRRRMSSNPQAIDRRRSTRSSLRPSAAIVVLTW